ncbi:MAG: type II toxin-antitoxin system RelE/ParE family toxin [Rubellimicrobium sp.]|nr:type II toxin-antitoxin system RelE/ParE family toxin [Rubellimicrobium sp.]
MKALVYSPEAQKDIDGIWDYSAANWGADQADRYVAGIRDACHALASGHRQGRPVRVGGRHYLKHAAGSHVIWFRSGPGGIVVVRILHGRQDAPRHI